MRQTAAAHYADLFAPAAQEADRVPTQGGGQTLKGQIFGRLSYSGRSRIRRHDKAGRIVQTLQDQSSAEQFVPFAVGDAGVSFLPFSRLLGLAAECWINWKVWFFVADRRPYVIAIFQQKEVTKERRRGVSETSLSECRPDVLGTSHRLFGAIVDIVAD
jgi:hypothetical protein